MLHWCSQYSDVVACELRGVKFILCLFQTFGTPNHHPKSQPFFDHIFTFAIADNRIWFRNYQILEENGELAEIGKVLISRVSMLAQNGFLLVPHSLQTICSYDL